MKRVVLAVILLLVFLAACEEAPVVEETPIPEPCGACEFFNGATCQKYVCCGNADCDDGSELTTERCVNAYTQASYCETISEFECTTDADCDDGKNRTVDECKGLERKCANYIISYCANGDGYCPRGCDEFEDSDCPPLTTPPVK